MESYLCSNMTGKQMTGEKPAQERGLRRNGHAAVFILCSGFGEGAVDFAEARKGRMCLKGLI